MSDPAVAAQRQQQRQQGLIAGLVTLADLTGVARRVFSDTYMPFEPFLTVAGIYLVMTFALVWLFKKAEQRWLAYLAPRKH